jgi:hypothetical protein
MKLVNFFFAGIIILSLLFLAASIIPETAHAIPKSFTTGEYPEAIGARCVDVDYQSKVQDEVAAGETSFVMSPNSNGPTLVHIGLHVDEITEVDEGSNTFKIQGFLDLIWCDPRLAFEPAGTGSQAEIFLEDDAYQELNQIWWPNLDFVNGEEEASLENLVLLVHPDGTVEYRSKFSSHLASNFNLHSFPFDEQDLLVEIESFEWASDTMIFLQQEGVVGFSEEFHIPEWYVTDISESIKSKKEIRDHSEFSELVAVIHVKRDSGMYVTKVMIPLGVIILITMVIFWMELDSFEDRLGTSMTGLLTAVAYQFIASQNLPKHIYNTYLDSFVFLSFLVILFGIGESAIVQWLLKNEKEEQAKQIDRISRWFMPVLYVAMIITLYFAYTR